MANNQDYTAGRVDSSIHEFLLAMEAAAPPSMEYALITCLDSCLDLPLLVKESREIQSAQLSGKLVGRGWLLKTNELLASERKQPIFFGFDEVFFFASPPRKSKPDAIVLVGPEKISQPIPAERLAWFRRNRCSLALGDGTGLNFVAKLQGIARFLVPYIVEHVS
jgi:hypothetical protein